MTLYKIFDEHLSTNILMSLSECPLAELQERSGEVGGTGTHTVDEDDQEAWAGRGSAAVLSYG